MVESDPKYRRAINKVFIHFHIGSLPGKIKCWGKAHIRLFINKSVDQRKGYSQFINSSNLHESKHHIDRC